MLKIKKGDSCNLINTGYFSEGVPISIVICKSLYKRVFIKFDEFNGFLYILVKGIVIIEIEVFIRKRKIRILFIYKIIFGKLN